MITINKVSSPTELRECLDIRFKVFVQGQNVPAEEEIDGKDEHSDHYLLLVDGTPAGTARVRYLERIAKIERVAILENYQGQGFGKKIMQIVLDDLENNLTISVLKLSSQTHAIPFYEKLGFTVCSEEYMDAGIPHKDMKKVNQNQDSHPIAPWKLYVTITLETLLTFYLATFCMGMYFTHQNGSWLIGIIMVLLYLSTIGICIKRIVEKFSFAAIMLMIPIAPLAVLIIVVTLIPLLQILQ